MGEWTKDFTVVFKYYDKNNIFNKNTINIWDISTYKLFIDKCPLNWN